jgi:hypothetical protein
MSEFKGTKEGWDKCSFQGEVNDDVFYICIGDVMTKMISEVKGQHYGVNNTEAVYNAKLISKAPEMLSALITTLEELRDIGVLKNQCDYIEQLIKEATEI